MSSPDGRAGPTQIARGNVLGTGISALNMHLALEFIASSIAARRPEYVCVVPAHTVMDCLADPELRRIVNSSGLATPDGMSVVWLLRLQGFHDVERVYGPDLMLEACRFGLPRGWNHFFYGGAPGVADRLAASLSDRYPDLQVAGTFTPPFRSLTGAEDREIIERINASGAELVWIGLSSPKQEVWMSEHKGKINAPLMIGVGAAFDFLSRRKRQAPQWMQRAGLEWLFRFASEPRRLWPRYRQYPRFMLLVLLQYLGLKSFPSE